MDGISSTLLCGQVQQVSLKLYNSGAFAMSDLRLASSHPQCFTLAEEDYSLQVNKNMKYLAHNSTKLNTQLNTRN